MSYPRTIKTLAAVLAVVIATTASAKNDANKRVNGFLLSSISQSDVISKERINRAPGGYKIEVPNAGVFVLLSARSTGRGNCQFHLPSLYKMIAANPGGFEKKTVIKINKIEIPEELDLGDHLCLGDGSGCELVIKSAEPAE